MRHLKLPYLFKRQRGDTIVEVLICLAIVGSALTISYGISRRSLYQIQDAGERAEMLSIGQTQLESLKNKLNNDDGTFIASVRGDTTPTNRAFCITNAGTVHRDITNPREVKCAVNRQGEFYMESPGPHCATADSGCLEAVDENYPYRVGITYRPYYLGATSDQVDEWYVFGGRWGAGGYGNAAGFSVVPIMYRQHPL